MSGCGSETPYSGGMTSAADSAGEGQVGRAEALPAEVGAVTGEPFCHEVELVPHRLLVFGLDPRADAELARDEAGHEGPAVAHRRGLPGRDTVVVEAQRQPALSQHVDVHQPPPARAEALVEAPAQALDLAARALLHGEQPLLRGGASVDPGEDLSRLPEHLVRRNQHGHRARAAGAPRDEPVDALDVAFLAVGDPGAVEAPSAPSRSSG